MRTVNVRETLIAGMARFTGATGGTVCEMDLADATALELLKKSETPLEKRTALLAEVLGVSREVDLLSRPTSAEFVEKIPIGFARRHGLIGLASMNGRMPVAMADLDALELLDGLSRFFSKPLTPLLASKQDISAAINGAYQQRSGQAQVLIDQVDGDVLEDIAELSKAEDLLDVSSRAPVIKMVNLMLFEAVKMQASDLHVQPYDDRLVVRMRIDGVLTDMYTLKKAIQEEIISRVKVMGRMNIAEKRLPQDGRATVQVGDRTVDLRIASLPTSFGERVVIRILDKSARLYTLGELGMDEVANRQFSELITADHGIILVTGPTGSGKSSTLYAALSEIKSGEINILTLEDPIEYQLEGVSQTQINEKKGMTFASGLRNVLRQDPDVIMVGEIRDPETAVMAIQSSLTGHLVFSTLHTNDAASAVTRLLDLGIEPYLVASSISAVLAQRLVRRICDDCAEPYVPDPAIWERLGVNAAHLDIEGLRRGSGCDACRQTGYRGRIGLFELLVCDETIQSLIQHRARAGEIKARAVESGMKVLAEDGLKKILGGVTTPEEVLRVTMRQSF